MAHSNVKTRAEHREYVRSLTKISFFFGYRWHLEHPGESIAQALYDRTPLFHHALSFVRDEGESHYAWQALLANAEAVVPTVRDAAEFEALMFAHVQDFADERADQFYPKSVGVKLPQGWNVRSLKYDAPLDSLPPNHCNFHIANALAPRSMLDDPEHLPLCFLEVMDRGEAEYGYDTLRTFTWLNDHPAWLAFVPQEWRDNLGPRSETLSWNFGHWGQLVNARGTFNDKIGQYVREHGELKYKPRASQCSFRAMREHLRGLLGRSRPSPSG